MRVGVYFSEEIRALVMMWAINVTSATACMERHLKSFNTVVEADKISVSSGFPVERPFLEGVDIGYGKYAHKSTNAPECHVSCGG